MAKPEKKTRTKTVETGETKADKFRRLANMRVSKVLSGIKNIGNLAGPGYESTIEQRTKIIEALNTAVDDVENKFNAPTSKSGGIAFTV